LRPWAILRLSSSGEYGVKRVRGSEGKGIAAPFVRAPLKFNRTDYRLSRVTFYFLGNPNARNRTHMPFYQLVAVFFTGRLGMHPKSLRSPVWPDSYADLNLRPKKNDLSREFARRLSWIRKPKLHRRATSAPENGFRRQALLNGAISFGCRTNQEKLTG
jgi:hypothetical protein